MENQLNTEKTSRFRNSRGKLDSYSLAEQLMEDYHVINLRDRLYIYTNGVYEYNMQELESAIRRLGRGAKLAEIKTTIQDLLSMSPAREESTYEYVAFNNCIVNVKTLETFNFDYDRFVITSRVYANYNKDVANDDTATAQLVDKFFNDISCGDIELKKLLFEIIGYCMLRTAKCQRAFILYGNANNGKSDYMHIISRVLDNYCTHQNLIQLSNLNNLKILYQRTANIIDDVIDIDKVKFSYIDPMITGGKISIKVTEEKEFSFEPYATLVFGTTHELDFSSCNDETIRRFRIVPFNTKFDKDTVNRNMTEMITAPASLDIIASRAIQAIQPVILSDKDWGFPASVERETDAYFFKGNPVLAFGKTHPIKSIISVDDYYREFAIWHINTFGVECNINIAVFGKRLSSLLNIKSIPHTIYGDKDTYYQASDFNYEMFRQQYETYRKSLGSGQTLMTPSQFAKHFDKLDEQNKE